MSRYRWGILATGNIAGSMAAALRHVPGAELTAVASRSQASADAFAQTWGVPRAYAGYDRLLADPDIDIVYVATPNALHRENTCAALAAGKHVLCEKPLTTSPEDTLACIDASERAGRFLMEAMWTAFFPVIATARALIAEGAIGTPRHLTAAFVSYRDPAQTPALFDPALGGGALLDLGIYPLTIAELLAGPIAGCQAELLRGPTGVDEMVVMAARHEGGVVSALSCGFRLEMPIAVQLRGDAGVLEIPETFHCPNRLILTRDTGREEIAVPPMGNGYAHEAIEVQRCLDAGARESAIFPLSTSLRLARLMASVTSAV